jgi:hypothetical protein
MIKVDRAFSAPGRGTIVIAENATAASRLKHAATMDMMRTGLIFGPSLLVEIA